MPTILIVEDDTLNLKLLSTILIAHNNSILTANNGQEAIFCTQAHLPDLVLMDINMPGMDGYEALAAIRANPKTRHIPVIAVTGNAMTHDLKKIRQSGFDNVISKPFKIDDLLETLELIFNA